MRQTLVLQLIICIAIIVYLLAKILWPVIRFYNQLEKVLKANERIRGFMCENPYFMEGRVPDRQKCKKDLEVLLDYSYKSKAEIKKAMEYYERIPFVAIKLFKMKHLYIQLFKLLESTNKGIWKIHCAV